MRRRWKSRLGVSTVMANMLMILITLSLAAILVAVGWNKLRSVHRRYPSILCRNAGRHSRKDS